MTHTPPMQAQIKERPILFSGEMVRAILDGAKTQTRRVVKPQRDTVNLGWDHFKGRISCPYGRSGERLWVKETFWIDEDDQPVCFYAATDCRSDIKLKPSIFMPRSLSRITLEILKVRVERLQQITEDDAVAEGVNEEFEMEVGSFIHGAPIQLSFRLGYKHLWDRINKDRGFGWDTNPLVWVIEFKRIKP